MSITWSLTLVSDPTRTAQGTLWLKAFRLTPTFMDLLGDDDFTPAKYDGR